MSAFGFEREGFEAYGEGVNRLMKELLSILQVRYINKSFLHTDTTLAQAFRQSSSLQASCVFFFRPLWLSYLE